MGKQGFEDKMYSLGFTKRIVTFDFFPRSVQKSIVFYGFRRRWTVGIWLNYQKQMMALRPVKNTQNETCIPFGEIRSVEVVGDEYTKTIFGGVGVGSFFGGSAKSEGFNRGLQVRITTGNIRSGTNAYFLNLWEPRLGAKLNKSDPNFKAIQECARSIIDEIEIIIQESQSVEKEHSEREVRQCPYCSEDILATAKKCKHCGEWLEGK